MESSMLSVSLHPNTPSPASSQSLTRHFIPSAQRSCWRWSTRANTLLSSWGTRPSTRCKGNTSLSNRRWCPPTTCAWDASAEVRDLALDMCNGDEERHCSEECAVVLLQSTPCLDRLTNVPACVCMCECMWMFAWVPCHISMHVLKEKKSRPSVWFAVQANPSHTLKRKKKRKPCCFCRSDTRTKATASSLTACPLCKIVQVVQPSRIFFFSLPFSQLYFLSK